MSGQDHPPTQDQLRPKINNGGARRTPGPRDGDDGRAGDGELPARVMAMMVLVTMGLVLSYPLDLACDIRYTCITRVKVCPMHTTGVQIFEPGTWDGKGTGTMTYTTVNYRTKKALKDAVAAGEDVTIYEPGLGAAPVNGTAYLEGPHYPEPHKWYAQATVKDGKVIKVK